VGYHRSGRAGGVERVSASGRAVHFASDGTPRRFIATTAAGLRKPAAIVPVSGGDLKTWPGGADLIIVTAPQFRAALQPLWPRASSRGCAWRWWTSIKSTTRSAPVSRTGGDPGFRTIRESALARTRAALSAAGRRCQLRPARLLGWHRVGYCSHAVGAHRVLRLDGIGRVVCPARRQRGGGSGPGVGRFPAQTADQLATMVAKTLEYASGDQTAAWRHDALLVADNDEPGFADAAKAFGDQLTGYRARVTTVAGDGSGTRQELSQAFAQGPGCWVISGTAVWSYGRRRRSWR